ncbi:MAG: hypothetical protein KC482_09795, partial [Dehalococcoidia bacterium]|nr:hypothetical protein [Dehalococcoidia bacterium]
ASSRRTIPPRAPPVASAGRQCCLRFGQAGLLARNWHHDVSQDAIVGVLEAARHMYAENRPLGASR